MRGFGAFDFRLARVCWFGRAVLWLAPEPVEPFVKLTGILAGQFGTAPYEDEFDEVIPHPVYAAQGWASIVCPGARTSEEARSLIADAHRRAAERYRRPS